MCDTVYRIFVCVLGGLLMILLQVQLSLEIFIDQRINGRDMFSCTFINRGQETLAVLHPSLAFISHLL